MKAVLRAFLAVLLLVVCGSPRAEVITFDTSESEFDGGTRNQGWYSTGRVNPVNQTTNDNYIIGFYGPDEYRDFFTFNLGRLIGVATSAILEVTRFESYPGTLALFDVSTDAATLNNNTVPNAAIFRDLASGTSYGTFMVPAAGFREDVLQFPLNASAVADLNKARGGFFSVGGTLWSGGPTFFAASSPGGIQRLVVTVAPVPEPGTLVFFGLAGVAIALRRARWCARAMRLSI